MLASHVTSHTEFVCLSSVCSISCFEYHGVAEAFYRASGVHSHISKLDSRPSVSVTVHSISWCSFHVCPINHHLLVTDMEISIIAQAEITLNVCGYVEDGFNICKLFQIILSVLREISAMIKRNKWNFKEMFCFVFSQGRKHWSFAGFLNPSRKGRYKFKLI